MAYGNTFGGVPQPSNNLWVGNNYSSGYSQMSRSNYPVNNNQNGMMPTLMQNQMSVQPINNVLQVMGPESAQAYQLGPDSQVILMDSNKPIFYMKKSDSSGYSETRAFEFHEIPLFSSTSSQSQTDVPSNSEFITKNEFNEFKKMIEELVMKDE